MVTIESIEGGNNIGGGSEDSEDTNGESGIMEQVVALEQVVLLMVIMLINLIMACHRHMR